MLLKCMVYFVMYSKVRTLDHDERIIHHNNNCMQGVGLA